MNFSSLLYDFKRGKEDEKFLFLCLWSPATISFSNDLWGSKVEPRCCRTNIFHHFLTIAWKCINLLCKFDSKPVTTRVCMCRLSVTAHTCVHERKQQSHSVWLRHEGEMKGYDDKKEREKGRDGWEQINAKPVKRSAPLWINMNTSAHADLSSLPLLNINISLDALSRS